MLSRDFEPAFSPESPKFIRGTTLRHGQTSHNSQEARMNPGTPHCRNHFLPRGT